MRESSYDQYLARTVCDVLEFTGIALVENRELSRINDVYWEFIREFHVLQSLAVSTEGSAQESTRDVWHLIERLELAMRAYILEVFKGQWQGFELDQLRKILGPERWTAIERIKNKASRNYQLSPDRLEREEMECMYLGDLVDLIISNQAWHHFKDDFRDKRQLQDLIASISQVRNDRAHFAQVPEKELARCRIACDDLIVIINQAVDEGVS